MHQKHPLADALSICSSLLAVASWQEQLDWGLRITASIVAIATGVFVIYDRVKRRKPIDQ